MNNDTDAITQADWDRAFAFDKAVGGVDTSLLAEYFRRHRTTSLAAQDGLVEKVRTAITGCHDDKSEWGKLRISDLMAIEAALASIEETPHGRTSREQ